MTDDRTRTPHDGKPYYCALCGCGLAEFVNCELPDCELETPAVAQARAPKIPAGGKPGTSMEA